MTEPTSPTLWRYVGLGAAGLLAWASYGAGSRRTLHTAILWPGVSWEAPTGGSPLLTGVAILAMGVWVLAWWRLRDAWVSVGWWQVTAGLWFAPLVASVPLYSRDLYSYAAQGALWHEGLSPYEHGVADLESEWRESTAPTWLDSTAPYGPVFLLLARGIAAVSGGHLLVALVLLRLVALVAVVVMVWAVPEIAKRLGVVDPEKATWLGVATPLVGAHFVSGAHNDALMVVGVLLGIALALRERYVWAVVVIALAAMVKVTAVVAVPFGALLWAASRPPVSWPRLVGRAGLTAGVALVPVVAVTLVTGLGFSWLNPASTSGKNEQWTSLPTALGMAIGAVGHLLGNPSWRDSGIAALRVLGLVVMVVLLVVIWLRAASRMTDRAAVVRSIGWALLAVIVLAPAFLGWYFLWVLPVLAASVSPREHPRVVTGLAVAATVLCFAQLPDGYSLGLTTTAVGVPIALAVTVLLVRAGWRWARVTDWRHFLDLPADATPETAGTSTLAP